MGNHVSATASCDLFAFLCRCCPFRRAEIVENLRENLGRLEIQKLRLKAMKDDILREFEHKVDRLLQFNLINEWINLVEAKVKEVDKSLCDKEEKLKKLFCGGCCSHLCCCCVYRFGSDIDRLLGDINLLIDQKTFDLSTYCPPALVQIEMPLTPLKEWPNWDVIRTTYLGKLVEKGTGAAGRTSGAGRGVEGGDAVRTGVEGGDAVRTGVEEVGAAGEIDSGVILGLWGPRGIGKTCMLRKINNELLHLFKLVIWVDAKGLDKMEIQSFIACRIGQSNELGWDSKSFYERSFVIYNYLKSKKFALLLDNLSSDVDLTDLGVPYPNESNEARIIFTTSDQDVYNGMHALAKVEICALEASEAWDLFSQIVGDVSDTVIEMAAGDILRVCGGVPRAIISVGKLMRGREVQEWYDHCNVLSACQSTMTQSLQLFEVDASEAYSQAIINHRMKSASTSRTKNDSTPNSGGTDVALKQQVDKCKEKVPELEKKLESDAIEPKNALDLLKTFSPSKDTAGKVTDKVSGLTKESSTSNEFGVPAKDSW